MQFCIIYVHGIHLLQNGLRGAEEDGILIPCASPLDGPHAISSQCLVRIRLCQKINQAQHIPPMFLLVSWPKIEEPISMVPIGEFKLGSSEK